MDKVEACPVRKFLEMPKDYYVEQISTNCLSQYAYYIESRGDAIVIDPMRDTEFISNILNKRNAKLKYIFETHFHADFVSGHLDLSNKTGAEIVFGPGARTKFKITNSEDNQIFNIGNIKIKVIHTPGHTMESISLVLIDESNKEKAVFTGDTLFLGDVGRPDLAVKENIDSKTLASHLYDSIQKIKCLNEEIIIFPGHGAGSACGKSIHAGNGDSLKNQKKTNFALQNLSKEEFINFTTINLPAPLQYFFYDVKMNREGYENLDVLLDKSLRALRHEEFEQLEKQENVIIIDTRDGNISTKGFLRGSYLIPLNMTYATWCATLFKPEYKILIIASAGTEKESLIRLFRVGYYNVLGYLEGGYDAVKSNENLANRITQIDKVGYEDAKKLIDENKVDLIDIRENAEFENTGIIDHSNLLPLSEFDKKISEIRTFKKPLGIFCRSGARAYIASSILKKNNINNFLWMGGFSGLVEKGAKVVKYVKK